MTRETFRCTTGDGASLLVEARRDGVCFIVDDFDAEEVGGGASVSVLLSVADARRVAEMILGVSDE